MNSDNPAEATTRRDDILEAAARLFRSQGYTATSMRQIARAAGYNTVAGLYNHFDSKEAIFAALLDRHAPYSEVFSAMEKIDGDDAETYLRNLLRAIVPIMMDRLDYLQLVLIDLQEFEGRMLAAFLQRVFPRFMQYLVHLMRFPEMRTDLPPAAIMRTIVAVTIGYLFTEMVARTSALEGLPFPLVLGEKWLDNLVSILMHGLTTGDAP